MKPYTERQTICLKKLMINYASAKNKRFENLWLNLTDTI
jgi:hypothetical protein